MLFFSLAPVFEGRQATATDDSLGAYDSDAQIHAAWLLWRAEALLPPGRRQAVLEAYSDLGFELASHLGQGDKVRYGKGDNVGVSERRGGEATPSDTPRKRKRAKGTAAEVGEAAEKAEAGEAAGGAGGAARLERLACAIVSRGDEGPEVEQERHG